MSDAFDKFYQQEKQKLDDKIRKLSQEKEGLDKEILSRRTELEVITGDLDKLKKKKKSLDDEIAAEFKKVEDQKAVMVSGVEAREKTINEKAAGLSEEEKKIAASRITLQEKINDLEVLKTSFLQAVKTLEITLKDDLEAYIQKANAL